MIPVFQPQISIHLTKVVKRTGATRTVESNDSPIDLARFLGDNGGVTVHRAIGGTDGSFTIILADRLDVATQDSLYARVEPMDHVIIRMTGTPHDPEHNPMPVVMRGFVTSVKRSEVMGTDGKAGRSVTISGHDYYKLLHNHQIFYRLEYQLGRALLTRFPFFETTGKNFIHVPVSKFVEEVVGLLNERLDLMKLRTKLAEPFSLGARASVKTGKISASVLNHFEGTLWTLITDQADLAWNEIYFDDDEDGQWLIYRPLPWYDFAGQRVSQDPGAVDAKEVRLSISDVVEMSLERSDLDVANYVGVQAPNTVLNTREPLITHYLQNGTFFPDGGAYPNADLSVYGLKKIEPTNHLYSDLSEHRIDDASREEKQASGGPAANYVKMRRDEVWAANKDNVMYERGKLKIRGNPAVRPGVYLRIKRGKTEFTCYVHGITHHYRPFHSYTTDVEVVRGTNFAGRLDSAGSPYLMEIS